MQSIATFSIETESVVLVQYPSGRKRRLAVSQLRQHLSRADVEKILAAYKLRESFIDSHMPRTHAIGLVILGAALLSLAGLSSQRALAQLFDHSPGTPQVLGRPSIAKSLNVPTSKPATVAKGSDAMLARLGVTSQVRYSHKKVQVRGGSVGSAVVGQIHAVAAPVPDVQLTPIPSSITPLKRPGQDSAASTESTAIDTVPVLAVPSPTPVPAIPITKAAEFTAAP